MPKKVLDAFFNSLVRDIRTQYSEGGRYRSVREIADRFHVSLQTAHRGVQLLKDRGFITIKRKAGITVASLNPSETEETYTIAVISAAHDQRFTNAFFRGIDEKARENNAAAFVCPAPDMDFRSLAFGEYLTTLDAGGIIALNFGNSPLPFFYALREGRDLVADIILDELPILPVIQTNNYFHSREAGSIFLDRGYRRFLVIGYFPRNRNRRFEGLRDRIKDECDEVEYVSLPESGAMGTVDRFFHYFNSRCAVFSTDYAANYIAGAKFAQYKIPVKNDNFLAYDSEEDFFTFQGLKPVRKVGPSFFTLGAELCNVLITKRKTGAYPLPLQRKI
jgi:DNA-binding transcriptional regulator YhcF (GntR family)